MNQQPPANFREQMLGRACVELLAELLEAVGHWQSLLNAGLHLALRVAKAERGLAFDTTGTMAFDGFALEEAQVLRQRLNRLLASAGLHRYSDPGFASPAKGAAPVTGMAGIIPTPGGSCVLAVERSREPLDSTDQQVMAEALRLLKHPFQETAEALRLWRDHGPAARRFSLTELPLERLEPFPQLQEVERLLIQEAMNRAGGSRSRAAAALGMTREGLRKKMIRFGMIG